MFAGLPASDLETFASVVSARHLEKGEYLFHEGQPSKGFYIVKDGAINIHRLSAAGKLQVIHVFHAGESFAEATLVSERGYPANARALMRSSVILVPRAAFIELLRRKPEVALHMLASMSAHLHSLVALLDDVTLKSVEARCIHWLLRDRELPASKTPFDVKLDRPKRVIAAQMNVASETLSRTLAKLRKQNLIRVAGKTITVLDPPRLRLLLRQSLGEE